MKKSICPKVLLSERSSKVWENEWSLEESFQIFVGPIENCLQAAIRKTMNRRHLTPSIFQVRYKISWNIHIFHCFELKLHSLLITLVTLLPMLRWWQPSCSFYCLYVCHFHCLEFCYLVWANPIHSSSLLFLCDHPDKAWKTTRKVTQKSPA